MKFSNPTNAKDAALFTFIVHHYQVVQKMLREHAESMANAILTAPTQFHFNWWRHGGWYVGNVYYPDSAIGCVSRNYPDKKWRIVCDSRRKGLNEEGDYTFKTRDEAALAEHTLCLQQWQERLDAATNPVSNSSMYDVPVKFIFEGCVKVQASSPEDARKIADASFGMTLNGGLHDSDNRIRNWNFDSHSEKQIGQPTCCY